MKIISVISIILSVIAISISSFAIKRSLEVSSLEADLRKSFGNDLANYDFTSAEASLKSENKIIISRDCLAWVKYDLSGGNNINRRVGSDLKIYDNDDYHGVKVLFVSYMRDGKEFFDIRAYKLQKGSNMWMPTFLGPFSTIDNPVLTAKIRSWSSNNDP